MPTENYDLRNVRILVERQ